jgi:hypothetical protein
LGWKKISLPSFNSQEFFLIAINSMFRILTVLLQTENLSKVE